MSPVYKSNQLITCSVLMPEQSEEFVCSFVYASNAMEERKSLWEDLKNHYEAPMFKNKRWIIKGDYNEILEGGEHSEFDISLRILVGMKDFQEVTRH